MDDQPQIWRSSIRSEWLNLTLKKGGFMSGAGALIIIFSGTFLPLSLLKIGGVPIFFMSLICIAKGWLPYRKLTSLQLKPHEIHYDGHFLVFLRGGKPLLKIAEASIQKIFYRENEKHYGIGLLLKRPIVDKVKVLQPHFKPNSVEECDLFFPYFSERSFHELETARQE